MRRFFTQPFRICCGLFAVLLSGGGYSVVAQSGTSFDENNLLYEQGQYEAAAAGFEALLADGTDSAAIRFNLGNALYQLGQVGAALAQYHEALAQSPSDPDIRANIQFTRDKLGANAVIPRSFWQQFLLQLTLNQWTLIGLVPYWLWLLGATALQLVPNKTPWLRQCTRLAGVAFLMGGLLLFSAANERLQKSYAVVSVKEAVVRFGPFAESKSSHNLVDGIEVQLLDTKDDWHQLRDPRGQVGWIRSEQVTPLRTLP